DRLQLELAERERSSRLETEKARAELEKAARKTEQPQELIAGIEYRKLVVAREQAERKLELAGELETANAEQRRQELRLVRSEIAELTADVARLAKAQSDLTIAAPRSGILMHRSSWNGDKFDVGSQVWRGQTVAEIPDPATLAVRAELPERDYLRVRAGMPVRVRVDGAGGVFPGKVASIGRTVRSKSQVQPIPVMDVEVRLDDPEARLKPGPAVRVELTVPDLVAEQTHCPTCAYPARGRWARRGCWPPAASGRRRRSPKPSPPASWCWKHAPTACCARRDPRRCRCRAPAGPRAGSNGCCPRAAG